MSRPTNKNCMNNLHRGQVISFSIEDYTALLVLFILRSNRLNFVYRYLKNQFKLSIFLWYSSFYFIQSSLHYSWKQMWTQTCLIQAWNHMTHNQFIIVYSPVKVEISFIIMYYVCIMKFRQFRWNFSLYWSHFSLLIQRDSGKSVLQIKFDQLLCQLMTVRVLLSWLQVCTIFYSTLNNLSFFHGRA